VQQVNNMQVAALHHMLDKDNLSYSTVLLICFARGGVNSLKIGDTMIRLPQTLGGDTNFVPPPNKKIISTNGI